MALLELKHVAKSFAHAKGTLQVLGDITFSVEEGHGSGESGSLIVGKRQ